MKKWSYILKRLYKMLYDNQVMNKLATYGVHLSEYSFATVSIPPALAAAT